MVSLGKSTFIRIHICLVSLFISVTLATSDYEEDYAVMGSTKKYCGPRLAGMLRDLCEDKYGTYFHTGKRSEWDVTYDEYLQSFNDQQSQIMNELPFAYQRYAYLAKLAPKTALGPRVRRQQIYTSKTGIVDKCCRNPCSVQEMLNYCLKKTI